MSTTWSLFNSSCCRYNYNDPLDALTLLMRPLQNEQFPLYQFEVRSPSIFLGFPPPALTCGIRISKPPRSPIVEAIQVFKASPSATSTAPPIALTPLPFKASVLS